MGMTSEKINLTIYSDISPWHLSRSVTMPKWSWLEKLIVGGKTVMWTVEIGWSYKNFFVLDILHTSRAHNSMI